jgi:hypothetical protein
LARTAHEVNGDSAIMTCNNSRKHGEVERIMQAPNGDGACHSCGLDNDSKMRIIPLMEKSYGPPSTKRGRHKPLGRDS